MPSTTYGNAGNDSWAFYSAPAGTFVLDGLGGIDSLNFGTTTKSAYTLVRYADGGMHVDSVSGATHALHGVLYNMERLKFADGSVAIDMGTSQSGGETALLIGAVLGRNLMLSKQPLLGTVIDLFDQGYSMQALAGALMRLPIWDVLTGKAAPGNADIARYLLTVTKGSAPDAATLAAAVQSLNAETGSAQGQFLASLALSADNQAQVGLVGLQSSGLPYVA